MTTNNALQVIAPYRSGGVWVFDDPVKQLVREPFVGEINRMIDQLTADIPDARSGFQLIFSPRPFPGYHLSVRKVRSEYDGTWYVCNELQTEGWLCPALLLYFAEAPDEIYVKAESNR